MRTAEGGGKRRRADTPAHSADHCKHFGGSFAADLGLRSHRATTAHFAAVAAHNQQADAAHRQAGADFPFDDGADAAEPEDPLQAPAAAADAKDAAPDPLQPPAQLPAPANDQPAPSMLPAAMAPLRAAADGRGPAVAANPAAAAGGEGQPPRIRLPQGPLGVLRSASATPRAPLPPDVPLSASADRLASSLTFSERLLAPAFAAMS